MFENLHSFELMLGSSRPEVFCKKVALKSFAKFTQGNTCAGVSIVKKLQDTRDFINKETLAHVFSCEFSEIFRGNFFAGHLQTATFEDSLFHDF